MCTCNYVEFCGTFFHFEVLKSMYIYSIDILASFWCTNVGEHMKDRIYLNCEERDEEII